MNAGAAAAAVTVAARALRRVCAYLSEDQAAQFGLQARAFVTVEGEGVGIGNARAGRLSICGAKGGRVCTLTAEPFDAQEGLWNGPDVIPNDWHDGSLEASLWHDLIWHYSEEIARQTGMSRQEVLHWGNGILTACWRGYAAQLYPDARAVGVKTAAAYAATEAARPWYHALKRLCRRAAGWFAAAALFAGLLGGCGGCVSAPDWEMRCASEISASVAAACEQGAGN